MLTFEQLKNYYSQDVKQYSPRNFLVEYLQYELLDSIYKQKGSEKLSFIGGTAIRIAYNGGRFSEDLDFDNFGLTYAEFEKLSNSVARDMGFKGFAVEFRTIEKGAYHCYIKFPHILRESGLPSATGEKILVRIDTVRKDKTFEPEICTLNKFDVYRDILVNPASIILAQKLITILERKREKGRDFYDTSYLFGLTQPDFSYIENFFGESKSEFAERFLEKCKSFDFKYLAKDVEPFLIQPDQSRRVLEFEKFIRGELIKK